MLYKIGRKCKRYKWITTGTKGRRTRLKDALKTTKQGHGRKTKPKGRNERDLNSLLTVQMDSNNEKGKVVMKGK